MNKENQLEWRLAQKVGPCSAHDNESKKLFDKEEVIKQPNERIREINEKILQKDVLNKAGVKYDDGKLRYDLYPLGAYAGCTAVLTFGANKYTPNGWKTVPDALNRYYAALVRHLNAQKEWLDKGNTGLALDTESGLPHLDHAQCCLVFLRELSNEKLTNEQKLQKNPDNKG